MNNRVMSLPNDYLRPPLHDPSAANLPNITSNVSAGNLSINHGNQYDRGGGGGSDESNILVAVRVRPLLQKELCINDIDIIREEGNLLVSAYYDYVLIMKLIHITDCFGPC